MQSKTTIQIESRYIKLKSTEMFLFDMSIKWKFVPEPYSTKWTHSFDAIESFMRPQTTAFVKIHLTTTAIPFGRLLFRFVNKNTFHQI